MDDLVKLENLVDQYLKQNNREAAVRTLHDLIVTCARRKEFAKAESLRERLIEVDPLALSEIVTTAEVIEEEMKRARPQDHMKLWSDLYGILSPDEGNALFYSMKEGSSFGTEPIFTQGERNSNLYFVNEGQFILFCKQGEKEIALKMAGPGEIVGEEAFFSDSVCTFGVRTYSRAKFHYLEKGVLTQWKEKYPALESKLMGFCRKFEKVHNLLKQKGFDRRSGRRFSISGQGVIQLVNNAGSLVGSPFKGELSDISASGLCFYIRLSKRETARLLLGRKMVLKFIIAAGKITVNVDQAGSVVAVRSHPFDDYTVHVRFDGVLNGRMVEDLAHLSEMAEKQYVTKSLH